MNRYASIFIVGLTLIFSFSSIALADNGTVTLGEGASVLAADGPTSVQVRVGECQFSISIKEGEHIKYNNPEVILYRANGRVPDRDLPFVRQAQTYSGYDWWFEKRGSRNVPWIGFMCESAENFKWHPDYIAADSTPALQDIMDENAINCPADFVKGKWVSASKSLNQFTSLNVAGGQGFVVNASNILKKGDKGARFCFLSGGNLLIGVSGGRADLLREDGPENSSLLNILRSIEFKSDVAPLK